MVPGLLACSVAWVVVSSCGWLVVSEWLCLVGCGWLVVAGWLCLVGWLVGWLQQFVGVEVGWC